MKLASIISAVAMTGVVALSSIAPAQAQTYMGHSQRDRVIYSYCAQHPRDNDCRSYSRGNWHNNDYNSFYNSRRSGLDSIASGLFGFTSI